MPVKTMPCEGSKFRGFRINVQSSGFGDQGKGFGFLACGLQGLVFKVYGTALLVSGFMLKVLASPDIVSMISPWWKLFTLEFQGL